MLEKTIAHYEVLDEIGAGGMGVIYRAHDTRLKRKVAIKALPKEFAKDAVRLARFEREARLLASLNNPHIVTVHGLECQIAFFADEEVGPAKTIPARFAACRPRAANRWWPGSKRSASLRGVDGVSAAAGVALDGAGLP